MKFKNWLIQESFNVEISKNISNIPAEVDSQGRHIKFFTPKEFNDFVKPILNNYFHGDLKNIENRYNVVLSNIREGYSEIIFQFDLIPVGNDKSNNPLSDLEKLPGWKVFKTPKEAIESIPEDDNLVYRGMSWEEWKFIRKTGKIQSNASYNIGKGQENLTFYGNAETATYYSSGFAPIQFKASVKKPGVVISIPRSFVQSHEDDPVNIPGGEFAHKGPLDASKIVNVWILTPSKARPGSFELVFQWKRIKDKLGNYSNNFYLTDPKEGSRFSPTISTAILKLK